MKRKEKRIFFFFLEVHLVRFIYYHLLRKELDKMCRMMLHPPFLGKKGENIEVLRLD
jgi:hypothetical protein